MHIILYIMYNMRLDDQKSPAPGHCRRGRGEGNDHRVTVASTRPTLGLWTVRVKGVPLSAFTT